MSLKVLIVEDAIFMSEIIKRFCILNGFEVVGEVQTGTDAVTQARIKSPDLIIMDLILPEMNGVEATDHILKENPSIEILACTTENNDWIIEQAKKIGIKYFIFKPFSKKEFEETLNSFTPNLKEVAHG